MIYVIQVESGNEPAVRDKLTAKGLCAYVPMRELLLRRNAEWTKAVNVMFPSYVFLECEYSYELHHRVKGIDGVIRFLGAPSPIGGDEEGFMRMMFNDGKIIPVSSAFVHADGSVTITGGWLLGKEQYVQHWNIRQRKALAVIRFGGKTHRVNFGVDFTKVF